jgi:hypothetical protein
VTPARIIARDFFVESVIDCRRHELSPPFRLHLSLRPRSVGLEGDQGHMTASNDNRRVRKKRGRGRGPDAIAKMARVLADIYALPANAAVNLQDDLLARLEDERHASAAHEREQNAVPAAEGAGS